MLGLGRGARTLKALRNVTGGKPPAQLSRRSKKIFGRAREMLSQRRTTKAAVARAEMAEKALAAAPKPTSIAGKSAIAGAGGVVGAGAMWRAGEERRRRQAAAQAMAAVQKPRRGRVVR